MKVKIKTYTQLGRTYTFDVEPSTTVENLKHQLLNRMNLSTDDNYSLNTLLSSQDEDLVNERRTLTSYEIQNEDLLEFHDLNRFSKNAVLTGCNIKFVDIASGGLKSVQWSNKAPKWRIAGRGLCLEGICENAECLANGKQIIMAIGYGKFDIRNDPDETTTSCPMCKQYVEPITCGFSNCWWRFEGSRVDENDKRRAPKKYSNEPQQVGDEYQYFDQETTSSVTWRKLVIFTSKEKL